MNNPVVVAVCLLNLRTFLHILGTIADRFRTFSHTHRGRLWANNVISEVMSSLLSQVSTIDDSHRAVLIRQALV